MHKIKSLLLATLLILPVFAHAEESYKTVFEKINQRMSYMQDVALYKINHHLAIEDVEREAIVVEKSKAASEKYSLDGNSTTEFTLYWSNETGHLIERQSMLINEVLYDRETYL